MKTQSYRNLSRVFLMLMMTVHVVTWYTFGVQAVGSIGIEAFFSGLSRGVINAGVIFWILVVLSAILLGRAFCGWFCWFGGYLELIEWGIGDKWKIKIPRRIFLYLGTLPFVALGLKIYSSLLVIWIEKGFPSIFTLRLADVEPWGGQQTGISILMTAVLYGPVLFFVFGRRAWCRYLCPIGALLKVFSPAKIGGVRLINDECIGCGKCNRTCDMQVDVMGDLNGHSEVNGLDCIVCLKCTDACPTNSIVLSLHRYDTALTSSAAGRAELSTLKRRKISALDISITVIWVGVSLYFFFSGARATAPQEIKVIMSVGLLLIVYGLVWTIRKTWAKFRQRR
ncbi:MAG: 4Fe-4S binding protein [Anaerolineae bacterium]|jgi:polyferredoxin|nr:4Fe-4S binding protein [Anaerolineae bacterium]MBT7190718.1 4Fe-4S binding protein [Anaerolineae bacterium]MBT7989706.1 4Fe-4S binding protein [Anaerolineae bacterium]